MTARPQTTQRLLRMLAAVHGQEWNASQIGKSLVQVDSELWALEIKLTTRPGLEDLARLNGHR